MIAQLDLFAAPVINHDATGKNADALAASRFEREQIVASFGGELPQSIIAHDKADRSLDLMAETRSYASCARPRNNGALGKVFDVSGQGSREGALSRFPQNVGRKLLILFTNEGDIVADPFAGHNSRMELCYRARRCYWGNDLSSEFMDANRRILEILNSEPQDMFIGGSPEIHLSVGDSRRLPWGNEFADFTITSPPYWDIEYYGDEPEQLGKSKRYSDFLAGLFDVAVENYRVLRHGAYCIWCVNDFRKDSRFYPYHSDVINILSTAGFDMHDIAITDLGEPIRAAFASQLVEWKVLPKRHEYCLIFIKP